MTTPRIRRNSAPLRIERSDERPTVILAHGSGASRKEWAPVVATLADRYRVLTPDLLGYGRSEPSAVKARFHPWSDLGTLIALAGGADAPLHLVGHSYGGALALEATRSLGPRVQSLTLIEPMAFHLLRLTGDESEMVPHIARLVSNYRSITAPTRLIAGQRTPAPARAIVDELAQILCDAHVRVLPRAGHMSPVTHPAEIAALVAEHIEGSYTLAVDGHERIMNRASTG
jgi:pimeloyl-ACP methyl ester carboxylesterase